MTTMASQKFHASVSEESSDVQMLDSKDPLGTVSSSVYVPSSSARVMDSIEPLVPTARVQVLDSKDPLVLPCVSWVLDEPVVGPSGVAAGSSGSLLAVASSSEDEDDDIFPAMPRLTGSSRNRNNLDELKSMWNWRKIFSNFGTSNQCIQFAEERGLIPTAKLCSYHKTQMSLSKHAGQVGKFRCRKSNCRTKQISRAIGTWFENARLSLTVIFQIMYAFSEGLTYYQAQKELICDDGLVVSTRTVANWFSYCRETVTTYELDNQRTQGKTIQIDEPKFGRRLKQKFRQKQNKHNFTQRLFEYSWRRRNMIEHLDPFEELITAIKHVYKFD